MTPLGYTLQVYSICRSTAQSRWSSSPTWTPEAPSLPRPLDLVYRAVKGSAHSCLWPTIQPIFSLHLFTPMAASTKTSLLNTLLIVWDSLPIVVDIWLLFLWRLNVLINSHFGHKPPPNEFFIFINKVGTWFVVFWVSWLLCVFAVFVNPGINWFPTPTRWMGQAE